MNTLEPRPTSIRIFLADGIPDGLRIVEKSNWTGRAVVVSRAQINRAFEREELTHPGIYVLTGASDDGAPRVYVGEADSLRDRIKQHVSGKEFWTRVVAFSSTNEGLNKAHVRYLEARLIGLAREANQWELENNTQPPAPPLSEADRADAEWFLEEMLVIFPLLGIDAFEPASGQTRKSAPGEQDHTPELFLHQQGVDARGQEVADGFVVFKGAQARTSETPSILEHISDLRRQLVDRGVLVANGNHLVFSQDFRFSSPSAAAGVLVGGSINGRSAWKDNRGVTLKRLQDDRAEAAG